MNVQVTPNLGILLTGVNTFIIIIQGVKIKVVVVVSAKLDFQAGSCQSVSGQNGDSFLTNFAKTMPYCD